jgi:hypothetical protein
MPGKPIWTRLIFVTKAGVYQSGATFSWKARVLRQGLWALLAANVFKTFDFM